MGTLMSAKLRAASGFQSKIRMRTDGKGNWFSCMLRLTVTDCAAGQESRWMAWG